MAYIYSFEKLNAWQRAIDLVKTIYACTQTFPKDERFGITGQIRRASISIPANIAEGVSRKTPKDQAYFSTIAYGSLTETLNLLIIAWELGYLSLDHYNHCRSQIEETSRLLTALRKSQQS